MGQPLPLTPHQYGAYWRRLFSSHDYSIDVSILDLNEREIGQVRLIDGQINLQPAEPLPAVTGVRRTASLTISDPDGALDFSGATEWSNTTVWVNRLIKITHSLKLPRHLGVPGDTVTVTPFIGPPSAISRNGPEVSVECQDKTALTVRGCSPHTVPKGMNAVRAIQDILARRTGEFRFRLGTNPRTLSHPYSVNWTDEASPWVIATLIARRELGMQLIYSCDGYVLLRPLPQMTSGLTTRMQIPFVTEQATQQADFTGLVNWVRATGGVGNPQTTTTTSGGVQRTVTTTAQPQSEEWIAAGPLSPRGLARRGLLPDGTRPQVDRFLPLLLQDDAWTTRVQTAAEASRALTEGSRIDTEPQFTCVPFFHCDVDDLLIVQLPGEDTVVRLGTASIPLGAGEMTFGAQRWVSQAPRRAARHVFNRTRTVAKKKVTPAKGSAKGKTRGKALRKA